MDRLTDYLLEHYLREPNYWRIDDQPVFAIFNLDSSKSYAGLLNIFGVEKLRKIFDGMRNRAVKAGLKGLHIQASHKYKAGETPLKELGIDSATHYHTFRGRPAGEDHGVCARRQSEVSSDGRKPPPSWTFLTSRTARWAGTTARALPATRTCSSIARPINMNNSCWRRNTLWQADGPSRR